jgi:hypothetical protein
MADDIILNHVSHGLITSDTADGVSLISCSPSKWVCSKEVLNVLSETNCRERKIRARKTLGAGEDIWGNTFVRLESKKLTASANASHDLIDDQENAVLITKSSYTLNNFRWINQDTSGASDSFHHDGSDCGRIFVDNGLLKVSEIVADRVLLGVSPSELECLQVKELNESTDSILGESSSEITSCINCTNRAPVIGLISTENFMLSSELSGSSYSDLIGITSGEREDETSDIRGGQIAEDLSEFGLRLSNGEATVHVVKSLKLVSDSIENWLGDSVSQVVVDCLGCHIDILISIVVKQIDTLTLFDGHC